jgi:hypothetical protein
MGSLAESWNEVAPKLSVMYAPPAAPSLRCFIFCLAVMGVSWFGG